MSTTSVGQQAETMVCELLESKNYKIIGKNWRTKRCEIDIIAKKNDIVYFCEVKFRSSDKQGSALEYITPSKLKQIMFAAELWCSENNWSGDYRILGAGVNQIAGELKVTEVVDVS